MLKQVPALVARAGPCLAVCGKRLTRRTSCQQSERGVGKGVGKIPSRDVCHRLQQERSVVVLRIRVLASRVDIDAEPNIDPRVFQSAGEAAGTAEEVDAVN